MEGKNPNQSEVLFCTISFTQLCFSFFQLKLGAFQKKFISSKSHSLGKLFLIYTPKHTQPFKPETLCQIHMHH